MTKNSFVSEVKFNVRKRKKAFNSSNKDNIFSTQFSAHIMLPSFITVA